MDMDIILHPSRCLDQVSCIRLFGVILEFVSALLELFAATQSCLGPVADTDAARDSAPTKKAGGANSVAIFLHVVEANRHMRSYVTKSFVKILAVLILRML